MNLIHNYIYKEIVLLTAAIVGVLTFLLVAVNLFKFVQILVHFDLPIWLASKVVLLVIPLTLTLTMPAGLLAAVLIVFGRMSSDRELLALKSSGIGLAPVVAPVVILAVGLSLVDYWLIAYVVPECQKEQNNMKHEMVTSNPKSFFTPEMIIDRLPGWKIYFSRMEEGDMIDVYLWKIEDNRVVSSTRARRARVDLDLEHEQLVLTLFNGQQDIYPKSGDVTKVTIGERGEQIPVAIPLNSFLDKIQKKLAWMTLPEIEDVIYTMQTAPTGEAPSPYLTELQARFSFSIAAITFVIIGIPMAIQTQRRETSWGVVLALLIVGVYFFMGSFGRGLKGNAGLYPELIIWAPNIIFQVIGLWLFERANRR